MGRRDSLMQVCHFFSLPPFLPLFLFPRGRRIGGVDPWRQPGASLHSISTALTHTWTYTHWWRWDWDRLRDGKTEGWELMQVRWQRYKLKSIHISSIRCEHQVQVEIVQQEAASQGTSGVRMLRADSDLLKSPQLHFWYAFLTVNRHSVHIYQCTKQFSTA